MNRIYKIVIVDDDEIAADVLCMKLKQYDFFCVDRIIQNGANARKLIPSLKPDLLFLDVELPDITGVELLNILRDNVNWDMRVIFYTAYQKYMIDAIRGTAFDYLLKPITQADLRAVVDRFLKLKDQPTLSSQFLPTRTIPGGRTFMITTPTNDMRVLRSSDIGFFRYRPERKCWEVVQNNYQLPLYLKKGVISKDITSFDPCFVQIHQSYIININYLLMVQDNRCILLPPFDTENDLLVSRIYKRKLQDMFYQL